MLYIRVDGNPEISTGHINRCLSIADAFKDKSIETTFIVADEYMKNSISERGHHVICLDSDYADMGKETNQMAQLIKERHVEKLIVDSYFVTFAYLQALRKLTYIVYIDDLNAFHYPCGMLINYNIYADKLDYQTRYPKTALLLGCGYAPLRKEFQNLPSRVLRKDVKSILVTTGGADPYNVAIKLVKAAKTNPYLRHLEFDIVAGQFHPNKNALELLEREYNGVNIHMNVKNMSQLMLNCDVAVSAGGSTLYELCACGTPTITLSLTDNQIAGVTDFGEGYMINAGDIRGNEELCFNGMLNGILQLASSYRLRCNLSEKTQKLVDGRGALRIAEALLFHL